VGLVGLAVVCRGAGENKEVLVDLLVAGRESGEVEVVLLASKTSLWFRDDIWHIAWSESYGTL
jgi:hypothetical protein